MSLILNMKKYVLFTPSIVNMGGAQMYVRNKCLHMQEQGWDVDIFTSQRGVIYISDLKKYDCVIPELGFDYFLFTKSKRERILKDILRRLAWEKYEEIAIESTCISESTWAEVVAARVGGRHLFYNLQEHNNINSKAEQSYLTFKYLRHELAGITDKSLYDMFLSFWPIKKEESYLLRAICNNVVEDVDCQLVGQIEQVNADFVVGCLSRIDKPFIIPALTDFIAYTKYHSDKQFVLLMIGGAADNSSSEKNIRKMIADAKNVKLFITGYMYPVPIKLLDTCDAFFTSAGSAWVCMRSGVPTISYDGYDFRPIGIMGRTTKSSLMRGEDEPPLEMATLLEDILENRKYAKEEQIYNLCKSDFSLHDAFLTEMSQAKEFFDFENVQKNGAEKKLSLLLSLVGAGAYYKLADIKKRIIKH